ncbi:MAG: hypothetical protein COA94_02175 [Rickettsiales bacterium]|nr:MAG: hypothetical protein COA94_02175 [Rickettsiales bacterium]
MEHKNKVTLENFNSSNVVIGTHEKKTFKGKDGKEDGDYITIPISYKYDGNTPTKGINLELPLVTCYVKKGKFGYQMSIKLDRTGKVYNVIKALESINISVGRMANTKRGAFSLKEEINLNEIYKCNFKDHIYRPRDDNTYEKLEVDPTLYLPVKSWSVFAIPVEQNGKIVSRDIKKENLENIKLEGHPLIKVVSMYMGGGKFSLQLYLSCIIITKVTKVSEVELMSDILGNVSGDAMVELGNNLAELGIPLMTDNPLNTEEDEKEEEGGDDIKAIEYKDL